MLESQLALAQGTAAKSNFPATNPVRDSSTRVSNFDVAENQHSVNVVIQLLVHSAPKQLRFVGEEQVAGEAYPVTILTVRAIDTSLL